MLLPKSKNRLQPRGRPYRDIEAGEQVGDAFGGAEYSVVDISISADGSLAVTANSDGTVRIWSLETSMQDAGQVLRPVFGVASVAISADGRRAVFGGGGGDVWIWDLARDEQAGNAFEGNGEEIFSVDISADGSRVLFVDSDGIFWVWNPDSGTPSSYEIKGDGGAPCDVAISADGSRAVLGTSEGALLVWDLDADKAVHGILGAHDGSACDVVISADGTRALTGGEDGSVRVWDLDLRTEVGDALVEYDAPVAVLAMSADGSRAVSRSRFTGLDVWDLQARVKEHALPDVDDFMFRDIAVSENGTRAISGGVDRKARVWDLETGRQLGAALEGHERGVETVALSADGSRALTNDGFPRIWSRETGRQLGAAISGQKTLFYSAAIFTNGRRAVTGVADGMMQVWDLETGRRVGEPIEAHMGPIEDVVISADGSWVVTNAGDIVFWNLDEHWEARGPFGMNLSRIDGVGLSADGSVAATGHADGMLYFWHLKKDTIFGPIKGHEGSVSGISLSADGKYAVSGGVDRRVHLWDLETDDVVTLEGSFLGVLSVSLAAEGGRAAFGDDGGTVRLWDLESLKQLASEKLCAALDIQLLSTRVILRCEDRFIFLNRSLNKIGSLFIWPNAVVAIVDGQGASFSVNEAIPLVKTVMQSGGKTEFLDEIRDIPYEEARRVLFDDYTPFERIWIRIIEFTTAVQSTYGDLNAISKAAAWLPIFIGGTWISAFLCWVLIPGRFCHFMLPKTGGDSTPPVKYVLDTVTLFRWVSQTGRPRRAWLKRHRTLLEEACFLERRPVEQRERFAELSLADGVTPPPKGQRLIAWLHGAGGSGKSAFAFAFVRKNLIAGRSKSIPVLVDENWDGSLAEHIAKLMHLDDWRGRGPTTDMIQHLGRMGLICPIVDSLSERTRKGAVEDVEGALARGEFRHLIVTSRSSPPSAQVWEKAIVIETKPLKPEDVPNFVEKYVDDPAERSIVQERISPLVDRPPLPSPLFLRFAIEQATADDIGSLARIDLVFRYVEAARANRVDVGAEDFRRAAGVSAIEAIRSDELRPRELEFEYLRGVLIREADSSRFLNETRDAAVDPARLIDDLVSCGILNRNAANRRLQFAFDPVAEYLAAWRLTTGPENAAVMELVRANENSELAAAVRELEAAGAAA